MVAGAGGGEEVPGQGAGARGGGQGAVEGAQVLHAAHPQQHFADPGEGRLVVGGGGQGEPLHQDLVVAPAHELEVRIQPEAVCLGDLAGQLLEVDQQLVGAPALDLAFRGPSPGSPGLGQGREGVQLGAAELRCRGGQARLVQVGSGVHGLQGTGQFGLHEGAELLSGDGGEAVGVHVVPEEAVEALLAYLALQGRHQAGALFVGDAGEGVVGIDALQVHAQHGQVGLGLEARQAVFQGLLAHGPAQGGGIIAVEGAEDLPLGPDGEAFVEPEVLHAGVGDQVAGPAVGQLVRHHIHQAAVPRQQGGGEEGHAGVLHPAVGEGGWQHQHVVAVPGVGAEEALGLHDHVLHSGELPGGGVDGLRLGPDPGPGAQVAAGQAAYGQGQQVAGDGLGHGEAEGVAAIPRGLVPGGAGAHDGREALGHRHLGLVGHAHHRRVLAGHHGAGMDLLTLAEEVGSHLALGLRGVQPLEGHGVRCCEVGDRNFVGAGGHVQTQATALDGVGLPQLPGDGAQARHLHGLDLQALGVQVQEPRDVPAELQHHLTSDALGVEVHPQLQAQAAGLGLGRIVVGVRIWKGHGDLMRLKMIPIPQTHEAPPAGPRI